MDADRKCIACAKKKRVDASFLCVNIPTMFVAVELALC